MIDRRLLLLAAPPSGGGRSRCAGSTGSDVEAAGTFEVEKSDSEWRRILTKAQYEVLRLHHTEVPGSSPLNHEKRKGIFACAACDLPLFSSETKYESGTGWPSFYRPLPNAVGTRTDHVAADPAHRGALPALRRASGPRVFRRAAADRAALLHERRCHEVHARRSSLITHIGMNASMSPADAAVLPRPAELRRSAPGAHYCPGRGSLPGRTAG